MAIDRKILRALPGNAITLPDMLEEVTLFTSPDGSAWATVREYDKYVTMPVVGQRGKVLRNWLISEYITRTGRVPKSGKIVETIRAAEALATHGGMRHPVNIRVAASDDEERVFLDLGDRAQQFVEITRAGWGVVPEVPVKFWRPGSMAPLPEPVPNGDIELLRPFLNLHDGTAGERQWVLLKAWLAGALNPNGPFPVLALEAEQGSGKSFTARILKDLIDPNYSPLRTSSGNERELAINASRQWVLAFDNLSTISSSFSDALCRVATGGGFSTRALYTDRDEALFAYVRPVLLNGIDSLTGRADLADRTIVMRLPAMRPDTRRSESELLADFQRVRPLILGALYTAVASALRNKRHIITTGSLPRMADFARWATGAEPALGLAPGSVINTLKDYHDEFAVESVEHDLVSAAIDRLMHRNASWTGTATELAEQIKPDKPVRDWPQTPRAVADRIRRAAPVLRKIGIQIEMPTSAGRRGRVYRIERNS